MTFSGFFFFFSYKSLPQLSQLSFFFLPQNPGNREFYFYSYERTFSFGVYKLWVFEIFLTSLTLIYPQHHFGTYLITSEYVIKGRMKCQVKIKRITILNSSMAKTLWLGKKTQLKLEVTKTLVV